MYYVAKIACAIILICMYYLWRDTTIMQIVLWTSLGYMTADLFNAAWERV